MLDIVYRDVEHFGKGRNDLICFYIYLEIYGAHSIQLVLIKLLQETSIMKTKRNRTPMCVLYV